MRNILLWTLLMLIPAIAQGTEKLNYIPLDPQNPVLFNGDHIIYKGEKIVLGPRAFFIDGRFPDEVTEKHPYVFNSVNKAVTELTDGEEEAPMILYLAPYVYWIDDPDDPAIRTSAAGRPPFGLEISCNWLTFYGLSDDPRNIVLASNRGQTHGALGNFTMFYLEGDGTAVENVTLGNYCSIDLEYPLLPEMNRKKRAEAIVQAQLAICKGDKITARNSHFLSRLNTCPLVGGKRTFFQNCYFECTDDALCGTGVHLDCRFTFYSSKPFYSTQGTGAVFLNCDIDVLTKSRQYFTKAGGQVSLIDTRFTYGSDSLYIGWINQPSPTLRCYQYNVTLNDDPVLLDPDYPGVTVDLTGKPLLNAYRIEDEGKVIYNTYNLLRGEDDWDPAGVKEEILRLERKGGFSLSDIPISMKANPGKIEFTAGESQPDLELTSFRGGSSISLDYPVRWVLSDRDKACLSLESRGNSYRVSGINDEDISYILYPKAIDANGLEGVVAITVNPPLLEAPAFIQEPKLSTGTSGELNVEYTIDQRGREDQSLITWYRCSDKKGNNPRVVAVSRLDQPERKYTLTRGDMGYYIAAEVTPRHLRSLPGESQTVVTLAPVVSSDIQNQYMLYTDFRNFPTHYQPEIIPGFWTVDCYKPLDVQQYDWEPSGKDSWFYGTGVDGAVGLGLLQTERGSRLLYAPVNSRSGGDMSVELVVDPCKTAGQGFGSATGQYMDIYIKFDTYTLTGYALRIERTPKNDRAVDFSLVKYENGVVAPLTDPITSVCYRTDCRIKLEVTDNRFKATAFTTTPLPEKSNPAVVTSVELEAAIEENGFGGTGIQHTGSAGGNATMLHEMRIIWGN